MKKIITFILFAVLLYCCLGCGSNYHLKKRDYHERMAIAKGAIISSDTVYEVRQFKFPAVNVKFEPKIVRPEDRYEPIIVVRDSIQVKLQWKKGKNNIDTVFVEAKIPERKLTAEVPISVNKKIGPSSKRHWPWILLLGIIIGATGTILIVRKLKISIQSK